MVANNHFDINGYLVRTEEAKILAGILKGYPLTSMIVCGDFNTAADTSPMQKLTSLTNLVFAKDIAQETSMTNFTTINENDFTTPKYGEIIDHILVSTPNVMVQKYEIWDNKINGKYPSDHVPVWAEIKVLG